MLLIGKKRSKKNPTDVGGAIVLFEQLLKDLRHYGVDFEVIDINYRNYKTKVQAFFFIYRKILTRGKKHDLLFFNGSNNGLTLFGIPIYWCKIFYGKKVILRFFGGDYNIYLKHLFPPLRSLMQQFVRKADFLFFEQKYQVDLFSGMNEHTYWFPNMRSITNQNELKKKDKTFQNRFIFISHVRSEKGINEILEVKKEWKEKFDIDIYGPILDYIPSDHLRETFEAIYKGPLHPDSVTTKLSRYDILVLPSYKEGYPGIIIEAFSLGLPVIATNLPSIKEMMGDLKSGILIEPKNITQLKKAIEYFNSENYEQYSKNALNAFSLFDSKIQMPKIIQLITSM